MSKETGYEPLTKAWKRKLKTRLCDWFAANARTLPWRESRDPYRIWVSEIMLQQTQVATVIPYFERFLHRFPDIAALAEASEEEVLRHWEGLGYYRRARHMHQAAKVVVRDHCGTFPRESKAVRALPGVGRYTAGAILSIAHDAREPILEANTIRLYSRLLNFREDPRSTSGQKTLWRFAEEILPDSDTGIFNQALMEVGSKVCVPRSPDCAECPLETLCRSRAEGTQAEIPSTPKRLKYEEVDHVCVVIWKRNKVLLRRYQEGERWAGLWDLPRMETSREELQPSRIEQRIQKMTGLRIQAGRELLRMKHGVTRYRITLHCYEAVCLGGRAKQEMKWVPLEELSEFPLNVTGRKICDRLSRPVA